MVNRTVTEGHTAMEAPTLGFCKCSSPVPEMIVADNCSSNLHVAHRDNRAVQDLGKGWEQARRENGQSTVEAAARCPISPQHRVHARLRRVSERAVCHSRAGDHVRIGGRCLVLRDEKYLEVDVTSCGGFARAWKLQSGAHGLYRPYLRSTTPAVGNQNAWRKAVIEMGVMVVFGSR